MWWSCVCVLKGEAADEVWDGIVGSGVGRGDRSVCVCVWGGSLRASVCGGGWGCVRGPPKGEWVWVRVRVCVRAA